MKNSHFLIFLACLGCVSQKQSYTVPPLSDDDELSEETLKTQESLDYSDCVHLPRGPHASDLRCQGFTLSEKLDMANNSRSLEDTMLTALTTQYSDLETKPIEMMIGGRKAFGREYTSDIVGAVGMYVLTEIPGKGVWTAACFGKRGLKLRVCKQSIQDTASKGGIKYMGAQKKANPMILGKEFKMKQGCWQPLEKKIVCDKTELSWTEDANPKELELQLVGRLKKTAKEASVEFSSTKIDCNVLGKKTSCQRLVLSKDNETQTYVTAIAQVQKSLLVCSIAGQTDLAEPCDTVISINRNSKK